MNRSTQILIVLFLTIFVSGCSNVHDIQFNVKGTAPLAEITHRVGNSTKSQGRQRLPYNHNGVALPDTEVSLTVRSLSQGAIIAEIIVDGKKVASGNMVPSQKLLRLKARTSASSYYQAKWIAGLFIVLVLGGLGISTYKGRSKGLR